MPLARHLATRVGESVRRHPHHRVPLLSGVAMRSCRSRLRPSPVTHRLPFLALVSAALVAGFLTFTPTPTAAAPHTPVAPPAANERSVPGRGASRPATMTDPDRGRAPSASTVWPAAA